MKSVFIFRRDLRLYDNTGLNKALNDSDEVLPCFILDPRQTKDNEYFSENAFQFMIQSLKELDDELKKLGSKLYLFKGTAHEVILSLKERGFEKVYCNRDYTPFSKERDKQIAETIDFESVHDALLNPPNAVLKDDGNPYTVFTPYYKKAKQLPVNACADLVNGNFASTMLDTVDFPDYKANTHIVGGRNAALNILSVVEDYLFYKDRRDKLFLDATTHLSPHNKFGTVSIREVYHKVANSLGKDHELVRQLYWRDFFTQIAANFPKVFGHEFQAKFSKVKWSYDESVFKKWCEGKTGFPIVDAGMRELNETGYMHNRARMIVASFLTKDLHIDWRWGEKYFAQKLVDYDPAVNNGSWQWASSTGCDAQPYFRVFNPWLQQKRFDMKAEYIKKWIPELKDEPADVIHNIEIYDIEGYPKPIVNHQDEKEITLERFKAVSQ